MYKENRKYNCTEELTRFQYGVSKLKRKQCLTYDSGIGVNNSTAEACHVLEKHDAYLRYQHSKCYDMSLSLFLLLKNEKSFKGHLGIPLTMRVNN